MWQFAFARCNLRHHNNGYYGKMKLPFQALTFQFVFFIPSFLPSITVFEHAYSRDIIAAWPRGKSQWCARKKTGWGLKQVFSQPVCPGISSKIWTGCDGQMSSSYGRQMSFSSHAISFVCCQDAEQCCLKHCKNERSVFKRWVQRGIIKPLVSRSAGARCDSSRCCFHKLFS